MQGGQTNRIQASQGVQDCMRSLVKHCKIYTRVALGSHNHVSGGLC